jgi:hypothetical protein
MGSANKRTDRMSLHMRLSRQRKGLNVEIGVGNIERAIGHDCWDCESDVLDV